MGGHSNVSRTFVGPPETNLSEYLIRALTYAASYGLDETHDQLTGREIADFLVRAVDVKKFDLNTFNNVQKGTWWRMLTAAYAKLGDLDEMKLKCLLEASGNWHWGQKPATPKEKFNTFNVGHLYGSVFQQGYLLIISQNHLRSIVDKFNDR